MGRKRREEEGIGGRSRSGALSDWSDQSDSSALPDRRPLSGLIKMKISKNNRYSLIILSIILIILPACRPPADNYLRMARIYRAQGREGDYYNAIKHYRQLNPSAGPNDMGTTGPQPTFSDSGESHSISEGSDRAALLRAYLFQTMEKVEKYEESYTLLDITREEERRDSSPRDIFPIIVSMDQGVLGVLFLTPRDYLYLLEGVGLYYRDRLHYQNPFLISGVMMGMRGRYEDAAAQFQEAVRLDPLNIRAYNNLGITYFKMGRFNDAVECFLKVLEISSGNIFARNNLGLTYLKLGDNSSAEESFKRVLMIEPFDLAANYLLGYLFYTEGKFQRAWRYYRAADEINPTLAWINYALGSVMVKLEKMYEAVDYFQKSLTLDPGFLKAYVSLGAVYTHEKMYPEAEQKFQQALDLDPDYAPAYYNLACVSALQNKKRAALDNLKKALKKGFKDYGLLLKDKELDNIRDEPAFVELLDKRS